MIKKYNLSKPKQYIKDGQEKTMWQNVGVMTEFIKDNGDVSRKIEIPAIGLDCQAFPFEEKTEKPANRVPVKPTREMTPEEEYNSIPPTKEVDDEVINDEDIPY